MRVLINDPLPAEIEAFLEERRRNGTDRFDEIWHGVLHVVPTPTGAYGDLLQQVGEQLAPPARRAGLTPVTGGINLGDADDFRIPDFAVLRDFSHELYYATAALVVEIVVPGDETFAKLPFYADRGVDEVVLVDPVERAIRWLGLLDSEYVDVRAGKVIEIVPADIAAAMLWPEIAG